MDCFRYGASARSPQKRSSIGLRMTQQLDATKLRCVKKRRIRPLSDIDVTQQ
jgi:hypothetical protein